MNYDLDYEIYQYIDQQAESDVSFKELLAQNDLTYASAKQKVREFQERYTHLLHHYPIRNQNAAALCHDLSEKMEQFPENQELWYLYFCTVTDTGLLNTINGVQSDEQGIRNYIRQQGRIQELTDFMEIQTKCREKLHRLKEHLKKALSVQETDCRQEFQLLCELTGQHTFLYGVTANQIYRDNLQSLLMYLNSSEVLKNVKPYLLFAVLSRKHGMMQSRAHFIPNLQTACQYQKYQIYSDNGKNFNLYQSYLELYEHLRRFYAQDSSIDIAFSDFCFANLSPLSEWYYLNCQPECNIPKTLRQKVMELMALSFPMLFCYEDHSGCDIGEFEAEHSEIYRLWETKADTEFVAQFLKLLEEGSDMQECVARLPDSQHYSAFAELFLYQLAEIALYDKMLDIAENWMK